MASRPDGALCREAADALGMDPRDVAAAVSSFFGEASHRLSRPALRDPARLWTAAAFREAAPSAHVPSLGRLVPLWSRWSRLRRRLAEGASALPRGRTDAAVADEQYARAAAGLPVDEGAVRASRRGAGRRRAWVALPGGRRREAAFTLKGGEAEP